MAWFLIRTKVIIRHYCVVYVASVNQALLTFIA